MIRRRKTVFGVTALLVALWAHACGDGAVEPEQPPPADPPRPTTVTVTPATATLTALVATVELAAEVRDQDGQVMAGATVSWSSSDASVVTVAPAGLVTAAGNGVATITATAGSASGTATITVAQEVGTVTVSPATDTLLTADTVRLAAEAVDANGNPVMGTEFKWASGDTLVAVVDGEGLVTGMSAGEVGITASSADVTGRALLTVVLPEPKIVAVSPDSVAFSAIGQTSQLVAEVRDQAGRTIEGVTVSWSSSDTLVAMVDSAGLVTALGSGTATVTVEAGMASGEAAVTVTQSAGSVVVSPATETIPLGDTLRLVAEAFDENGHVVEPALFDWSSSDVSVLQVSPSGLVTGLAEGQGTVTAVTGDVQGTAEITVENPDRAALVALYNATDGPNWVNGENWLTDAPLGQWYGVDTNASGRVVRLVLKGRRRLSNGLAGALPPELGDLAHLEELDFAYNNLTGAIPPELGELSNLLHLRLYYNALTGPIPPELGALTNLRSLDLYFNSLTGPVPSELAGLANLELLSLGRNRLTGTIPPWLGEITKLRELSLILNEFEGPIPPELGNLVDLSELSLFRNDLTGAIPPQLGRLSNLRTFHLHYNDLSGPIPPELGDLVHLEELDFAYNNLTGPVPPELGNLSSLRSLFLENNDLTGVVPSELGGLSRLEFIGLSGNLLTGSIPSTFTGLNNLQGLSCNSTLGLCIPATEEFREWATQVRVRGRFAVPVEFSFCDEIDRRALGALFEAADGGGWTRAEGWLEDGGLNEWHGVRTDSIGRVSALDLTNNGLVGHVPETLGLLAGMTSLRIRDNGLSGRLPLSLADLALEEFDYSGTSLCVADDPHFWSWLARIAAHRGTGIQCPPLTDREILETVYRSTEGLNWQRSTGWLTDAPLSQWDGVETDATGRVVALALDGNSLTGAIPKELGRLSELRRLDLSNNSLSGVIPSALGNLDRLERLDLSINQLADQIPAQLGKLSKLKTLFLHYNRLSGTIPPELRTLTELEALDFSWNQLGGQTPEWFGTLAELRSLSLTGNRLTGIIPSEMTALIRLESLDFGRNQLSGPIPEWFGKLGELRLLGLSANRLTGAIPSEVGELVHLEYLDLGQNQLSGPIPKEVGRLASLRRLRLSANSLSGSIPAELGALPNLVALILGENQFVGPVPSEIGMATSLEVLDLRSNALSGSLPAELGSLTRLRSMILANNPELSGPLPVDITALERLERLMAGETELCRPADSRFDAWFRNIRDRRLVRCDGGAAVYLTQTVQSWDDPVPLLAGEPALLRVFVTAVSGGTATMPDIRATFFVQGIERHSVMIPASSQSIPSEVMEGDLALSANAEIPGWVIVPGLEMLVEVDPGGTLDPSLKVTKRIPESGRFVVDVRPVPSFDLTMIPFVLESDPDFSVVEDVQAMAADPHGHELLRDVRRLLPIAEMKVVAHEPVMTSNIHALSVIGQVEATRIMEGIAGYSMGIIDGRGYGAAGRAYLAGQASVSIAQPTTIAHELGHNLSLLHAPCGGPAGVDPWFPHLNATIGAWGYDFEQDTLVTPHAYDLMSYCTDRGYWISDFSFNQAISHRISRGSSESAAAAAVTGSVPTLLIWGGRDADGVLYLDPAFVVDAMPSLPDSGGDYSVDGATMDGTPLFSISFDMPVQADAQGEETSFVFALPLQPAWAGNLASITLSGPDGSFVLDGDTDRPMAILRDPETGHVRGFLRDLPPAAQAAGDAAGQVGGPDIEVLFSRGIPDPAAWRR